jgi:hypothetical protein
MFAAEVLLLVELAQERNDGWPYVRAAVVISADALLMSDCAASYRRFAQDAGIRHEWVNVHAGVHARGDIHIQHVNGWHSRFKGWLAKCRGVASRYLAHYSGWQRVRDAGQLIKPAQPLLVAAKLYS